MYYAKDNPENRLSEIKALVSLRSNSNTAIVDHALYTDQDKWFILGEVVSKAFLLLWNWTRY